jgi:putative membrane protein
VSVVDPRVSLAAERTLLAWIRTGLALMGFGFVVARFGLLLRELAVASPTPVAEPKLSASFVGIALVAFGIVVTASASARYWRIGQALERGQSPAISLTPPTIVGAVAAVGGVVLVVLLLLAAR